MQIFHHEYDSLIYKHKNRQGNLTFGYNLRHNRP